MKRISKWITSSWRHYDVIHYEIRVIAPHILNWKNYIFDLMQFSLFNVANTLILFIWSNGGKFEVL